jgi:hypothetical protein
MSTLRVEALEQPDGTAFVFNNKNLLINGGMNVWQRSTSATGITGVGYNSADRYYLSLNSQGTWTQSRSTDVPSAQGFGYSLKMDCTTADASPASGDYLFLEQRLEGQNLQHLLKGTSGAKKLTLSFWVKSSKTGTYICEIDDNDNSRNINKSYTINSANTWQKIEITFDGDTSGVLDNDNDFSLRVIFWLGAGSDFTSGTLATSWESTTNANRAVGQVNLADSTSNEWYVTGIQLEVGSTASGFEFEPYETVLYKCQRYYDQNTGQIWGGSAATNNTVQWANARYTREMRATPTITHYGNGTSGAVRRSNGATINLNNPTIGRNSKAVEFTQRNNSFSSGVWYQSGYIADAEL